MEDVTAKKVFVHGMHDVFVIGYQQAADKRLERFEPHCWSTFPETHPVFGKDDDHESLVHESPRYGQPSHCCSGPVFQIYWAKRSPAAAILRCYWGLMEKYGTSSRLHLTHQSVTSDLEKVPTSRGYAPDTSALAMHRFHRRFTYQGFLAKTTPAFVHVGKFLGHYWILFQSKTQQKQAATICERSHVYANCEEVRAIVEMRLPGEDVQEAEEEHMKDLCNKYGFAYDDGVKRRRVAPVPSLSIKYDADARQMHLAVCWKAGYFSDVRALVEQTVPGQQVAALRPKPPKIRQQSAGKPQNTVSYSDDEDYVPALKTFAEWEYKPVVLVGKRARAAVKYS